MACDDPGKDKHRFSAYGLTLPAGATITGIEVRLDAKANAPAGSPVMCVELSWDGGATWTAKRDGLRRQQLSRSKRDLR